MRTWVTTFLLMLAAIAATAPAGATIVHVKMKLTAFNPTLLGVTVGDTVQWDDQDAVSHTSTSGTPPIGDGMWDTGLVGPGTNAQVEMLTTGSFDYFCDVHNLMTGTIQVSAPVGVGPGAPVQVRLLLPRPNPARGQVELSFELAGSGQARLTLLDVTGREVSLLVDGRLGPGRHAVTWDGVTASGTRAASGLYFYRLDSGSQHITKRLLWLR